MIHAGDALYLGYVCIGGALMQFERFKRDATAFLAPVLPRSTLGSAMVYVFCFGYLLTWPVACPLLWLATREDPTP
jgi:hypothetical protein